MRLTLWPYETGVSEASSWINAQRTSTFASKPGTLTEIIAGGNWKLDYHPAQHLISFSNLHTKVHRTFCAYDVVSMLLHAVMQSRWFVLAQDWFIAYQSERFHDHLLSWRVQAWGTHTVMERDTCTNTCIHKWDGGVRSKFYHSVQHGLGAKPTYNR